jgi:hypothetical protein
MTDIISQTPQHEFEERIRPYAEALDYAVKDNSHPRSKTIIHTHYFNEDGLEIGYWSHYTQTSMIFDTPRPWDPEIKEMVRASTN